MISPTASQPGAQDEPDRGASVGLFKLSAHVVPESAELSASRRVLFLDDDPERAEVFLKENPLAVWVQTVPECLSRLLEPWDEVHLDHDLGGKTFVDMNESDCGMEVIRWLCAERREHLRPASFIIHTHNSLAGLFMVLQMRSMGYAAEFRPFGIDPAKMLAGGDDEPDLGSQWYPEKRPPHAALRTLRRWIGMLKGYWISSRPPRP